MNAVALSTPVARFTKIGADGAVLPPDAAEWEAVLDNTTGLMWAVKAIRVSNGREATVRAAVAKCRAAGFSDWQAPEVEPLFALADRSRATTSSRIARNQSTSAARADLRTTAIRAGQGIAIV